MQKGDLIIDPPPDESQLDSCAVSLRLGNQFAGPRVTEKAFIEVHERPPRFLEEAGLEPFTVELGQQVVLHPGTHMVATTLEYIGLPMDLLALLWGWSAFSRLGIMVWGGTVDPGYRGKIALAVDAFGRTPVVVYPGSRIVRVAFAPIEPFAHHYRDSHVSMRSGVGPSSPAFDVELERLKGLLSARALEVESRPVPSNEIRELLDEALLAKDRDKGTKLEKLVVKIFSTIRGVKILKVDARLKAEELDVVLQNDLHVGFWRFAGSPVFVECKNWSKKVGAAEIGSLSEKLQSIGPDAKTAILVAPNGVSGDSRRDAVLKIREKRQQGQYIIVLDREALEQMADGTHPAEVIERKYGELLVI